MKTFSLLIMMLFLSIFCSCLNEKFIYKGNKLYKCEQLPANPNSQTPTEESNTLISLKVNKGFKSSISEKNDFLIIKPSEVQKFEEVRIPLPGVIEGRLAENSGSIYFPELNHDPSACQSPKLRYFDSKPVLQGLTIPLKVRPRLNSESLLDSFPPQTETGFNLGIAIGWKFSHNVYKPNKNILGQNTNKFSFAPGIFVGLGGVDLKKSNTRNPVIRFERRAPMISYGGFLMFGFNSLNFGYSIGFDYAQGLGRREWLYHGKVWHGLILALDILK